MNGKNLKTIFNLKPDKHFYAINVRIRVNNNVGNKKPLKFKKNQYDFNRPKVLIRNKNMIQRRKRKREMNISRLIDVRFWTINETKDFLRVCVNGKYQDTFILHNVKGKRFEFITVELLKYCNIQSDDAENIINSRNFFIDCQKIIQEFEMNGGCHIKKGNNSEIQYKIDDLNQLLTECVAKKYLCQHIGCVSFINKYEKIYNYIDHYIKTLQNKMVSEKKQPLNEGRKINNGGNIQNRKFNMVIENRDMFICDYSLFTHEEAIGNRGCIVVTIKNINFCKWFYGGVCTNTVINLIEKK
eukprot:210883_1